MTDGFPPPTDSAKQRAQRIPLDYHQRVTGLERTKWFLTLLVGGAAGAYAVWVLVGWWGGSPRASMQLSPAPVAAVHASWEGKCSACHIAGVPLRGDSVALSHAAAWLQGKPPADHAASDAKCSACHAGPAHHSNQIAAEVESCAGCHRDHQGKDADLARVADSVCTACHADIAHHRSGPSIFPGKDVNVASFQSHPQFRSLAGGDTGRLKFNHWQHLLPGQVPSDAKDSLRKASKITQLDCAYCHQPDQAGQYMQPINYEKHCAACHADDLVLKGDVSGAIPHGLKAEAVHTVLIGLATGNNLGPASLSPSRPLQPIPGKTPGQNLAQQITPEIATRIGRAEASLTAGEAHCAKCHEFSSSPASPAIMPEIVPPALPATWLQHARFDHAVHRDVKCTDCHAGALPPKEHTSGDIPLDNTKLLIPNLDNCQRCHAPAGSSPTAGARTDCVECHKYHGSDVSLGGRGSRQAAAFENIAPTRLSRSFALPSQPASPVQFVSMMDSKADTPTFVGSATCASAGCHGKPLADRSQAWQTAYTVWASEDPHRRAFVVLYTERSVEIYRNLTPGAIRAANPPEDAAYLRFLKERCFGCHTTVESLGGAAGEPSEYLDGVSCESCHGPASKWLDSHYRTNWPNLPKHGFSDTADVPTRAAVCTACHVGPLEIDGRSFAVNHDLIASGHPRLTFELDAYLANLPAHWDRAGEAGSHFRNWLAGREASRIRLGRLVQSSERIEEFAAFECFDCHQSLKVPGKSQPFTLLPGERRGIPRLNRALLEPWPLAAGESDKTSDPLLLAQLIERKPATELTWDEAVLLYLGSAALLGDLPRDRKGRIDLAFTFVVLHTELEQMAGPTQYDSPTNFDPARLTEPFAEIAKALRNIAPPNSGGSP